MSPQNILIKGEFYGWCHSNARGGGGSPGLAAGGCSTETSYLPILLAAGWRENGGASVGENTEANSTKH